MRKLLFLALACTVLQATGQTFYFPKAFYKDSAALDKSMPALAKQVVATYKEPNKSDYYDNLFRYLLVAGQYEDAVKVLDSLRGLLSSADSISVKGIGFQFQTYAAAKMRQAERQISFADAYKNIFSRLYNALPELAATNASAYFLTDIQPIHENFNKLLTNQQGKDSISFEDARQLCRAYNSFNVYSKILPLGSPLIAELDNKQFFIEDSVLIKTRDGAIVSATIVRKKDAQANLPAIFVFNIYNSPRDKSLAKEAAIKGYAGVVVNTRGKRLSPQAIEPFEHDANDAYDIIDWISKQPWNNGSMSACLVEVIWDLVSGQQQKIFTLL